MNPNASISSKREVLAIKLLNHANVEEGTLKHAKLQLKSHLESCAAQVKNPKTTAVSAQDFESLSSVVKTNSQIHGLLYPKRSENELKESLLKLGRLFRATTEKLGRHFDKILTSAKDSG